MKNAPYEKLQFYQNICKIRLEVVKITTDLPKNNLRLISQMKDAARSAKQNIREGYRKGSAAEFGKHIKISAGSLAEIEGDVDDCFEDGFLNDM